MNFSRTTAYFPLWGASRFVRAAACVALAAIMAACSPQASEQELLDRARAALDQGEARAAIIDIKTALQQDADSADGRRLLGEAYLYQQDPATASDEFARSLQAVEDAEVRVLYARALLSAGQGEKLLELDAGGGFSGVADNPRYLAVLAQALAMGAEADTAKARQAQEMMDRARLAAPEDAYVATAHSLFLLRYLGALEEARASLENTVELHPDHADAWSMLGGIQQLSGEYVQAEASYARAVELNPFRFPDRLNLVAVRIDRGETKAAQEELDRLEARNPKHPAVNFLQGRMLLGAGDYAGALARFAAVLAVLPDHNNAQYLAAIANIHEGNHATALTLLESFLAGQPGHLNARLLLTHVHLQLNQAESSEEMARDILEEHPGNYSALGQLAAALNARGMHGESAAVYQRMVSAQPDTVDPRLALGTELLLAGDGAGGIAELKAVRNLAPDSAAARELLIGAYLKAGNVSAARAEAEAYGAQDSKGPRPSIFLGRIALQENDKPLARKHFQRALALDPGNVIANGGLAVLASGEKDFEQARKHYRDAIAHHPGDLGSLMNLAVIEGAMGNAEAMRVNLETAMKAEPRALAPRLALARINLNQGHGGEALALLMEVRDEFPGEPQLWLLLTEAMMATGDLPSAAGAAAKLLELSPENPIALATVARLELRSGRYPEAEQHLAAALELQPDNSDLRKLLADALVGQGKMKMAGDMLAGLSADVAAEPAVQVAMGRIALAQDRPAEAEPFFRSAMAAEPASMTLVWLSSAVAGQGRPDEALELVTDWLESNPRDGQVRSYLASTYLRLGRETDAREHYLKAVETAPDNVMILNNLSWLYRKDNPQRALGYIEKANRLAPDNPFIKDTYAMVQLERGDYSGALSLNQKALDGMPGNPEILFHRAVILHADGQGEEAIPILEELAGESGFARRDEARNLLAELRGL